MRSQRFRFLYKNQSIIFNNFQYKTEKDGVIETRVEHRVTIHSGSDIDHDAELAKALLEATELSPDLIINRVEVQKTQQS